MLEFYEKYKKIFQVLTLLLVFFFAYIALAKVDTFLKDTPFREKKVELSGLQLNGYNNAGNLVWTVKAKNAWSSYSIDYSNIEDIYEGVLYDDKGKSLIKNFKAKSIRVNAPQERVNASGGISGELCQKNRNLKITGQQLQYFSQDEKTYVFGEVKVIDKDLLITADNVQIDHKTKISSFSGNLLISKDGTTITGQSLAINLDTEEGLVKENVLLRRKANPKSTEEFKQKDTELTCQELTFKDVSGNTEAFCQGNIKIRQEDKQGIAEKGYFYAKNDLLILTGKVNLIFEKSAWLLDENTVNKLKQKDLKTALYEKLIILADQVEISTKTKDFTAHKNITVTMKEKEAVSDQAIYKQKEKKIYMTGNVRLKKSDGSWVKAEQVIVDMDQEIFSAEGKVESTIILKR